MNFTGWTPKRKDKNIRSKILIFLFCLFFSSVAWLSIKLSGEASTLIPVSLSIENLPSNIIISESTDSVFLFTVRSTGIRILTSSSMRSTVTLKPDFSSLQKMGVNGNLRYFITAQQAESLYSLINGVPRNQIGAEPDTIFFETERAFRKRVPLVTERQIDFAQGFRLYGFPSFKPDSVDVSGPYYLKDSIHNVNTEPIRLGNVRSNVNMELKLINPYIDQGVAFSHNSVKVSIPVEEFTEATVELPITLDCNNLNHLINDKTIILFPNMVTLVYLVALKDMRTIVPEMFSITAACPDSTGSRSSRLPLTVSQHPGLIEIVRVRPADVEYVWIKED